MYRIFRQLENGEFLHVVSLDEFEEAVRFVEALNTLWPAKYEVRNSEGNDINFKNNLSERMAG